MAAAFIGPGTITMCSIAGAQFKYALIWALLVSILLTMFIQLTAIEHIVIVPGPINAAATTDPGPICFNR